jgi:hypothetical protein
MLSRDWRLQGNTSNTNSYELFLGLNLLPLSPDGDQANNTKYWLLIEEVDSHSGNTTGNSFRSEDFFIYLQSTAATTTTDTPSVSTSYIISAISTTPSTFSTTTLTNTLQQTWSQGAAPSATETTTLLLPSETQTAPPVASSDSSTAGYTVDQNIALGIGIGLGLPTALAVCFKLVRWIIKQRCKRLYSYGKDI